MTPRRRWTSSRLSVILAAASFATACSDITPPLQLLPADVEPSAVRRAAATHPAAGVLSERVAIAGLPTGVAVSPKGQVFVTRLLSQLLATFTLAQPQQVDAQLLVPSGPIDVVLNKAGTRAYVGSINNSGAVHVINVAKNEVIEVITIEPGVYRLALSADESRLFVATVGGRLWSIRTQGPPRPTSVDLASGLSGLKVAPSGAVYASTLGGYVYRIDPTTLSIEASMLLFGSAFRDIALAPDGSALWVVNESNGYVRHLDPTTLALGTFITLDYWGGQPYAIDFSPDGVQAFVTSPATGTVFIIERPAPNTYNIKPVVLGGAPQRIAFGENGATALITNEQNWVDIVR